MRAVKLGLEQAACVGEGCFRSLSGQGFSSDCALLAIAVVSSLTVVNIRLICLKETKGPKLTFFDGQYCHSIYFNKNLT